MRLHRFLQISLNQNSLCMPVVIIKMFKKIYNTNHFDAVVRTVDVAGVAVVKVV